MSVSAVLDGAIAPALNTKLFGHDEAERFLARAYRSGRIHHAVLIEGPEGIGKATLAFRFARHVLAHPDQATAPEGMAEPDEASALYRQIGQGASHHLVHLTRPVDEKTGKVRTAITVDEVRRAGRLFTQTSGTGNWRIVIVDPADDMNRSAANAILKMLEEPPDRALFLVVSHAPGRLLPTIRSRCLALRLTPLDPPAMHDALAHLPMTAAMDATKRARVIARSDGSVARALMIVNYGGLDIIEAFEAILKQGPDDSAKAVHALADMLAGKDRDEIFHFFKAHVEEWITLEARNAGMAGDIARAASLAALSERVAVDLRTAEAYNLDRKQTVLSLFQGIFSPGPA